MPLAIHIHGLCCWILGSLKKNSVLRFSIFCFLQTLLARLDSKDWVKTCEALNNVRQLAIYHKERLQELL